MIKPKVRISHKCNLTSNNKHPFIIIATLVILHELYLTPIAQINQGYDNTCSRNNITLLRLLTVTGSDLRRPDNFENIIHFGPFSFTLKKKKFFKISFIYFFFIFKFFFFFVLGGSKIFDVNPCFPQRFQQLYNVSTCSG